MAQGRWPPLNERIHMPQPSTGANAFECANPILRVASLAASVRYYVEVLGFTNAEWGGESEGDQGQPGTWVWVGVGDVRALYAWALGLSPWA
jgi:hypothetical protein